MATPATRNTCPELLSPGWFAVDTLGEYASKNMHIAENGDVYFKDIKGKAFKDPVAKRCALGCQANVTTGTKLFPYQTCQNACTSGRKKKRACAGKVTAPDGYSAEEHAIASLGLLEWTLLSRSCNIDAALYECLTKVQELPAINIAGCRYMRKLMVEKSGNILRAKWERTTTKAQPGTVAPHSADDAVHCKTVKNT
jgi:hypothetical protein